MPQMSYAVEEDALPDTLNNWSAKDHFSCFFFKALSALSISPYLNT